jgi:hypothetical protein
LQRHEFDEAPQYRAAQRQRRVRDGSTKNIAHVSFSISEVIKRPHGHPAIVKELVNDLLQVDQFHDHGHFTPKFRAEA